MLNSEQLKALGIKGDWVMGLPDFVRYSDLDSYNHVNNKIYHAWFENLRVIYMAESGFDFTDKTAAMPVVRSANIEYNAAMFMGEEYVTVIRCSKVGNTSFDLDYAVYCAGTVRANGQTRIVMADLAAGKPVPLRDEIRALFKERDKATG
jgi:acyl-CoA thioester hydrolase